MRRPEITATKSNLIRLKERFGFVQSGHALLDQKREVLLEELMEMYRDARQLRQEMAVALAAVYRGVRDGLLAGGRVSLEAVALASTESLQLRTRERSVMGVIVPLLELAAAAPDGPQTAPGRSPVAAAQTRRRVRELLPALVRLAEVEVACRRLAAELQKTQRKVNALENIFIPDYRDTIRFIEGALEEKEREGLFHMKRLKARRQRADSEAEHG
jgi:V/A-type H+/Na+-transporting ATPase subunit D